MKCYAEKNFDKEFLKKIDIQNVGVYFDVPIKDLTPSFRDEFDFDDFEKEQGTMLLDYHTIYNNDEYVETYKNIEYDYTDSFEIDEFINKLINSKKYNHYLVVLFNSTWNNASGYKIFDNYNKCFHRDYDCSMYYVNSTPKGKSITLKEYHHDCPMGHTSVIIGLTEIEYQRLNNANPKDIIKFAKQYEMREDYGN